MMSGRNLRRSLLGLGSAVRGKSVALRGVPGIAELEGLLTLPGASWTAEFEARLDAVTLALFGLVNADTRPAEPRIDGLLVDLPPRSAVPEEVQRTHDRAMAEWGEWQQAMAKLDDAIARRGATAYFLGFGYDVTDETGIELRCLPFIQRPLYAAIKSLHPAAKLTLDGSGKRPASSTEEWGASLARDAALFRPSR